MDGWTESSGAKERLTATMTAGCMGGRAACLPACAVLYVDGM